MANTELSNKLNSALRYGTTAGGSIFMMMGVLSLLTPDQVASLKGDLETLKTSVLTGYGALMDMWVVLGPVAAGIAIKLGWNSSSVQAMGSKLFNIAKNHTDPSSTEAKIAIVNAAASPEIGSKGVVNPEMASNPATSPNVVAHTDALPQS